MIEISHLHKRFGKFVALRDITLSLTPGGITGIVGPNGSGKSTLIKTVLGLVTPTSGAVTLNGVPVTGSAEYRRRIGYMPQVARFPPDLTGAEILSMLRRLRDVSPCRERELIELFDLDRELGKRTRTLSGGTRQKLSAVICCMYDPELLILDEPTAGLDPLSATRLKDLILSLRRRKRTIILTSHIMSDMEHLPDEIVFLLDGEIHYLGGVHALKQQTGQAHFEQAIAHLLKARAA